MERPPFIFAYFFTWSYHSFRAWAGLGPPGVIRQHGSEDTALVSAATTLKSELSSDKGLSAGHQHNRVRKLCCPWGYRDLRERSRGLGQHSQSL